MLDVKNSIVPSNPPGPPGIFRSVAKTTLEIRTYFRSSFPLRPKKGLEGWRAGGDIVCSGLGGKIYKIAMHEPRAQSFTKMLLESKHWFISKMNTQLSIPTKTPTETKDVVVEASTKALLAAFDGCHKIYLAMDEYQAKYFRENYQEEDDVVVEGDADIMLETLIEWWNESCSLRFIEAVHTDQNQETVFTTLIPQQGHWLLANIVLHEQIAE